MTKKVDVPDGLTGNKDAEFTFKFTVPKGKTYKAAVFEKAGAADEKQVGDMFDLTNGREQTITPARRSACTVSPRVTSIRFRS